MEFRYNVALVLICLLLFGCTNPGGVQSGEIFGKITSGGGPEDKQLYLNIKLNYDSDWEYNSFTVPDEKEIQSLYHALCEVGSVSGENTNYYYCKDYKIYLMRQRISSEGQIGKWEYLTVKGFSFPKVALKENKDYGNDGEWQKYEVDLKEIIFNVTYDTLSYKQGQAIPLRELLEPITDYITQ
jgi:hypothetical protein